MRRVDFMVGTHDFKALKAEQFMQDAVNFHDVNHTGEQIAQEMTEEGFGSVPVQNSEGKVVGIITEFDLLKSIRKDKVLANTTAGDMMTPNPVTVSPDTSSGDLMRLLEDHHLIRMPVVDSEGKLLGIVARRDILKGYLKTTEQRRGFWP